MIISVNREETNHKIVDNWYIDVGRMDIQSLDTMFKVLSQIVHTVKKLRHPWSLENHYGGYSVLGPLPKDYQMLACRVLIIYMAENSGNIYRDKGELHVP